MDPRPEVLASPAHPSFAQRVTQLVGETLLAFRSTRAADGELPRVQGQRRRRRSKGSARIPLCFIGGLI